MAASQSEAAAAALHAGVDVELPAVRCYGAPLGRAVATGRADKAAVDQAAARVLTRKCELGMLDPDCGARSWRGRSDLDPPGHRELAGRLAEESVVLLANPAGVLPLPTAGRVAVVGPLADDPLAFLRCCSRQGISARRILKPRRACQRSRYWRRCAPSLPLPTRSSSAPSAARIRIRSTPRCSPRPSPPPSRDMTIAVVGDEARGCSARARLGRGLRPTDLRLPGVTGPARGPGRNRYTGRSPSW